MGPQKHKNETQKIVDSRGIFVCVPLWAGRINEKKYKNETEVRGILTIQVSSLPV